MKKFTVMAIALCLSLSVLGGAAITADAYAVENSGLDIKAKSAVLMDYDTGTVVYSKNERERLPIASMVKIMTLTLTLEEIDCGNLSPDDLVTASENAASMGGSQAFLDAHSEYTVNELIKSS